MVFMPRLRASRAAAFVLALALAAPARAQNALPAQPGPTAEQLQNLVNTINNPVERQKLVGELQALIAAQQALAQQQPPAPATLLDKLSSGIDALTGEVVAAAQVFVDAPRLIGWLRTQVENKPERDFWIGVTVRLIVIFGVGFVADRATLFVLRPLRLRLADRSGSSVAAQLFLMALVFVLEALPAAAFATAAFVAVPFTRPAFGTRQVARVLIGAILWARVVLAAARVLLLSASAQALYPMTGETRHYLYIWARRFALWAIYGFQLASAAWWLGVPGAIYALILRFTILALAVLGIVFVLQNRRAVADWLRGNSNGGWSVVRQRLADTWHILAIIYVIGTFGVYALNIGGGYLFLLRATVATVVVLLTAALVVRFIERLSRRGFAVSPEQRMRYPTLEARANRYLPAVFYILSTLIYIFAALTVLQAWGISAYSWLGTEESRRATGTVLKIGVVVVTALVAWEAFSSAIERMIVSSEAGATPARAARLRTLLPVLRNTVLIVIVVLVGLIVLSEFGVNIAPLLAGAGVVGLAVGFASQALLKDLIIGIIILAEDTLAVGEVVDVGKGPGVVEGLTMRALRMRDQSGTLVTVPFSEVTTVRNMTRNYAFAVHDVGVVYREDPDRVIAVLKEVAEEMARDPAWTQRVMPPLEVLGLDRFTDSAQVIRVRLKTEPLQQFMVQREFNRRMKKAFDAAGIEMPAANQTHYLPDKP
jgi:moderate conductance mechanosensitive channel